MKTNYKEKLNHVSTFIFDVDGVLTDGSVLLIPGHDAVRNFNSKDGFALQLAMKKNYRVAIISGGKSNGVKEHLNYLGVNDVYLAVKEKKTRLEAYLKEHNLKPEEVLYMGDDLPDYEVMQNVGVACSPADAAQEVKAISDYVSLKRGGKGCVRDVIEQTLKVQHRWMEDGDGVW